jgi:hypothetical protein
LSKRRGKHDVVIGWGFCCGLLEFQGFGGVITYGHDFIDAGVEGSKVETF